MAQSYNKQYSVTCRIHHKQLFIQSCMKMTPDWSVWSRKQATRLLLQPVDHDKDVCHPHAWIIQNESWLYMAQPAACERKLDQSKKWYLSVRTNRGPIITKRFAYASVGCSFGPLEPYPSIRERCGHVIACICANMYTERNHCTSPEPTKLPIYMTALCNAKHGIAHSFRVVSVTAIDLLYRSRPQQVWPVACWINMAIIDYSCTDHVHNDTQL